MTTPGWRVACVSGLLTSLLAFMAWSTLSSPAAPNEALHLDEVRAWEFPAQDAPLGAVALTPEVIAVVPPDRRHVVITDGSRRHEVTVPHDELLTAIAAQDSLVWVGAGSRLYSFHPSSARATLRFDFARSGQITSIAHSDDRVWFVFRDSAGSELVSINLAHDGLLGQMHLGSGGVTVHPLSNHSVLLQQVEFPFGVRSVGVGLGVEWEFTLPQDSLSRFVGDGANWLAGAALNIGNTILLQWLMDLQSVGRVAVIIDLRTRDVVRTRLLHSPMGLLQVLKGDTLALAARELLEGGRELVLYRVGLRRAEDMSEEERRTNQGAVPRTSVSRNGAKEDV